MDTQTLINVLLVVFFVLLGGVFAATEMALVSLRESQLSAMERTGPRGAKVASVARDPNRFLAAVQIGVTVAGFLSAAYGGSMLAPDVAPLLVKLGLSESTASTTALIVLTLIIAYLSLVLGELVPKRLALQRSAGMALAVTPALDRFAVLMRPVIWLLSKSTNAIVRLLGGNPEATTESLSEEELKELVSTHEALEDDERQILGDVLSATDMPIRQVMRPRGDVTFISAAEPITAAAQRLAELPFSRFPVTGTDVDDVLGFIHVRDVLGAKADDTRTVGDVLRPVLVLPESNLVLATVATMRQNGSHLAVVVDEYGGTEGIITLEDLIEELIGEIRDENDQGQDVDAVFDPAVIDGGTSVADFREETGVEMPDGDYDTIAGFVLESLGKIPAVGDEVVVADRVLEVTQMRHNRIITLALRPSPTE